MGKRLPRGGFRRRDGELGGPVGLALGRDQALPVVDHVHDLHRGNAAVEYQVKVSFKVIGANGAANGKGVFPWAIQAFKQGGGKARAFFIGPERIFARAARGVLIRYPPVLEEFFGLG